MNSPNNDDFYLLIDVLERNYFKYFRKGIKTLELLLSSNNLLNVCSNCTLQTNELYPNQNIFEPRLNSNKFDNLLLLIDWYIKNEFICDIEFNGCLEDENNDNLYNTLSIILNKFKQVKNNKHPNAIIFHTKMKNINLIKTIEQLFEDSDIRPCFYIHLDGYYCDNNYSEKEYNDIINYTIGNTHFYYKAIINNKNINNWINNYQWWISKLGLNNFLSQMYLDETLNDKWDYNSVNEYINFLNFQIDYLINNLDNFNSYIFENISTGFNNPLTIQLLDQEILTNIKYYQNCAFHNSVIIDLATMKIPACCQLNYPIYHLGEFNLEENNLVIHPLNLSISIPKAHLKRSSTPHCEYCLYLNLCEKTCYGENFKVSYNPLCPIKESCYLKQHKYCFLLSKYQKLNLLNLEDYNLTEAFKKDIAQIIAQINKKGIKYDF